MYMLSKRAIDIMVACSVLILAAPLLIPLMLALRLTAEGHVFYSQQRVGYKNRSFDIWKFVTMLKDSPNLGTGSLTVKNDFRVTPVGKYLRKSKINELPQVFNVLIGNMSLVGPRPQMEVDFLKFPKHIQEVIYNVKPGITGIGSIVFRDEEKLISSAAGDPHEFYKNHVAPYKGDLEIWYQQHLSFYTDMMLIFLTAWVIVFPESSLPFKIFKDLPPRTGA